MNGLMHKYISDAEWQSEGFRQERLKAAKQWYCRLNKVITDDQFKEDYLLTDKEFNEVKRFLEETNEGINKCLQNYLQALGGC